MSEALKLDAITRNFTQGARTLEVLKGADLAVRAEAAHYSQTGGTGPAKSF